MPRHRQFIAVQARGLLALPKDVRTRLGLDRAGAQVEVVERDDGVIELHPHVAVPADQAWFWTERWQRMEREADDQIGRGELTTYESSVDFLSSLEKVERDR
jgi:bifunctional DNA-binding transcriptional regulator/antitoxin component of YhaV-PrlF toxin-antitoxin module